MKTPPFALALGVWAILQGSSLAQTQTVPEIPPCAKSIPFVSDSVAKSRNKFGFAAHNASSTNCTPQRVASVYLKKEFSVTISYWHDMEMEEYIDDPCDEDPPYLHCVTYNITPSESYAFTITIEYDKDIFTIDEDPNDWCGFVIGEPVSTNIVGTISSSGSDSQECEGEPLSRNSCSISAIGVSEDGQSPIWSGSCYAEFGEFDWENDFENYFACGPLATWSAGYTNNNSWSGPLTYGHDNEELSASQSVVLSEEFTTGDLYDMINQAISSYPNSWTGSGLAIRALAENELCATLGKFKWKASIETERDVEYDFIKVRTYTYEWDTNLVYAYDVETETIMGTGAVVEKEDEEMPPGFGPGQAWGTATKRIALYLLRKDSACGTTCGRAGGGFAGAPGGFGSGDESGPGLGEDGLQW